MFPLTIQKSTRLANKGIGLRANQLPVAKNDSSFISGNVQVQAVGLGADQTRTGDVSSQLGAKRGVWSTDPQEECFALGQKTQASACIDIDMSTSAAAQKETNATIKKATLAPITSALAPKIAARKTKKNAIAAPHGRDNNLSGKIKTALYKPQKPQPFNIQVSSHTIPKVGDGDDVVYTSFPLDEKDNCCILAVADGVGGWSEFGFDASLFAKGLVEGLSHQANDATPMALLEASCAYARKKKHTGGSTMCIVKIDPLIRRLQAVNLGDSGFVVLRRVSPHVEATASATAMTSAGATSAGATSAGATSVGATSAGATATGKMDEKVKIESIKYRVAMRTQAQQTQFNLPKQLSFVSDELRAAHEGEFMNDVPGDADRYAMDLQVGDLVIVASDGVFDNLYDRDLISLAQEQHTRHKQMDAKYFASSIAWAAFQRSISMCATPFADHSKGKYFGGKRDDISVIVACIDA